MWEATIKGAKGHKGKRKFSEVLDFFMKVIRKIQKVEWQMKKLLGEKDNPTVEKEGNEIIEYE